jgi:hypothetical protein
VTLSRFTCHIPAVCIFILLFCFVLFCFLTFEVHLLPPYFEVVFYYSQPSFCLIHRTVRTARIQLKQHKSYIVTAFYPFPYKCIHLSAFCVSKQHGHEQDKVSLAVLLFVVHKTSTACCVGKYCMNLPKSFLELVQKKMFRTTYVLCLMWF